MRGHELGPLLVLELLARLQVERDAMGLHFPGAFVGPRLDALPFFFLEAGLLLLVELSLFFDRPFDLFHPSGEGFFQGDPLLLFGDVGFTAGLASLLDGRGQALEILVRGVDLLERFLVVQGLQGQAAKLFRRPERLHGDVVLGQKGEPGLLLLGDLGEVGQGRSDLRFGDLVGCQDAHGLRRFLGGHGVVGAGDLLLHGSLLSLW